MSPQEKLSISLESPGQEESNGSNLVKLGQLEVFQKLV